MESTTNRNSNARPNFGLRSKVALAGCILAVVVVVLGAFTRLVDAGLGCPDWPGCYGHLTWPDEAHEIQSANKAFPDAPVDGSKTWPEMVHRYFAGILLLVVATLTYLSWRSPNKRTLKQTNLLMALIVLQAIFGMWTVTLKLWPQVVTAHLLGGMATLSMLWLLIERMRKTPIYIPVDKYRALQRLRPLAFLAVLVIVLQIALGGWTSSNYAALACPDFPTCHGEWWPQADFQEGFNITQQIGPNYLGGALESDARTAIHLSHRIGALLVTLVVFTLAILNWRVGLHRWALILSGLLLFQLGLGIANVIMFLPLPIAVAHNAGAALLLLVTLTFYYRIQIVQPSGIEDSEAQTNLVLPRSALTGEL
ncbi:heme A synthase [Microbulbifer sp. NBRC 101763]